MLVECAGSASGTPADLAACAASSAKMPRDQRLSTEKKKKHSKHRKANFPVATLLSKATPKTTMVGSSGVHSSSRLSNCVAQARMTLEEVHCNQPRHGLACHASWPSRLATRVQELQPCADLPRPARAMTASSSWMA